jgi:hypothetical protein
MLRATRRLGSGFQVHLRQLWTLSPPLARWRWPSLRTSFTANLARVRTPFSFRLRPCVSARRTSPNDHKEFAGLPM